MSTPTPENDGIRPIDEHQDRIDRGAAIAARLNTLGISQRAFAERLEIDRATLAKALDGDPTLRTRKLMEIERALADLDEEMGGERDETTPGLVTFRVSGDFGVDVVVEGPVRNLPELQQSVRDIIAQVGQRKET